MDLFSQPNIKNLLKKYGVFPSKGLGQNFLTDRLILEKLIEAANITKEDTVLEIGPGIGNLTWELAQKAKRVIAVEKDPKMVKILKETLRDLKNIKIIQADIRKFQIQNTEYKIQDTYKVVGNLPFYLTAPVIRKFLEAENSPKEIIFIVQKEVAQRICAKPPDMNLLAVSVQFYAKPEIISYVPKESFWPQPKVDGAILKISAFNQREKSAFNQRFFEVVRAGFSQPRKMLVNNLSRLRPSGFGRQAKKLKKDKPRSRASSLRGKEKIKNWLLENGIQPTQRAETLNIKDWENLTKTFPQ